MPSREFSLISDHLKIVFQHDQKSFRFTTEVYSMDGWQPATTVPNSVIAGWDAEQCLYAGAGLHLRGAGPGYRWESTVTEQAGGFWFTTTLDVDQNVTLNPLLMLWLGKLDQMDDRQAHTWRQTILRAPTSNQQGLPGNDVAAGYVYDDAAKLETICYFPADQLQWLPQRLCQYTVREVFDYAAVHRYGFGLLPTSVTGGLTFTAGSYTMHWWFTQRRRTQTPSTWQAQRILLNALQPLLQTTPSQLPNAVTWQTMAEGALFDLENPACWTTIDGRDGLRAYVAGSSRLGRDRAGGFELMTQLDVLCPLLLWQQLPVDHALLTRAVRLVHRLIATLESFRRPDLRFVANNFPPHIGDSFMDTWYFLENALIKLPWAAYLTGNETLKEMFFEALSGATELAHNVGYVFPLFADAVDWSARGSLLNISVGGLYAAGHVLAHQFNSDPLHLREAERALQTMMQFPPAQLTHEPQQLSFGAAAANYLAGVYADMSNTEQDNPELQAKQGFYRTAAIDLLGLLLRMGYGERDPIVPYADQRGMFQACASLCYPAFKENVESLLALPEVLRTIQIEELAAGNGAAVLRMLAGFANLQRQHNLSFFDAYLPAELRIGPCPHIPYEDLATTEFPHTATLGKELYGAGEVFWSALLFDALAQVNDPDVLCLSLDVPCLQLRLIPSLEQRQFLVFNPTNQQKTVIVRFDAASKHQLSVTIDPLAFRKCSLSAVQGVLS